MSIRLLLNADESGIEHVFLSNEEIANLVISDHNDLHANDKVDDEEPVKLTHDEKLKGLSVVILKLNPAKTVEPEYIVSYEESRSLRC
ncbi:uncharacterized protein CCR75_003386 [Bremia lactucae]|uniref:Uncharacterized protein n=1 Tax=Bremia lactucae TaxID=4779 RepID=A0A976FI86_BRELC|nr:hypothetical protein CCR75_003386 [Bremia lactucae]